MNHHYKDIRSRIREEPKWFDEYAVPRYCEFAPDETANIYTNQAALVLIRCQGCHREFQVCLSSIARDKGSIENEIRDKSLHYGDPPNIECCAAGPTMNSEPLKVLEFWGMGDRMKWHRDATLEIVLDESHIANS